MKRIVFLLAATAWVAECSGPPEALTRERLRLAAEAAGFEVGAVSADIPVAVRPRFAFTTFEYDDPLLETLRKEYFLENVVAGAADEWTAQLRLKDWVFRQIPGGNPKHSVRNSLDILKFAAQGETFYCTHYTMTYLEAAQALGWQARKIAVDRKHGPEGMGSSHHGVAEVWSNQFRKWVVIDAQSNLHFEKKGLPLSAWEIRAEWLKNKGADVDHVVGAPPKTVKKNPAMVWTVPDEDEIATYFWLSVDLYASTEAGASPRIFPQDAANAGEIWYQNDGRTKRGRLHIAYTRNLFIPTTRIEDAYWTVCVIEARVANATPGNIRLGVDSYCPTRTEYQVSWDGLAWESVRDEQAIDWKLQAGWNYIRLRTKSRGGTLGPETAAVMFLEKAGGQ